MEGLIPAEAWGVIEVEMRLVPCSRRERIFLIDDLREVLEGKRVTMSGEGAR